MKSNISFRVPRTFFVLLWLDVLFLAHRLFVHVFITEPEIESPFYHFGGFIAFNAYVHIYITNFCIFALSAAIITILLLYYFHKQPPVLLQKICMIVWIVLMLLYILVFCFRLFWEPLFFFLGAYPVVFALWGILMALGFYPWLQRK